MTLQDDIFSKKQLKHYQALALAEDFAKTTLEFIFTARYTSQNINEEIKELTMDWSKEQVFMFWYQLKKHLNGRIKVLINSIFPFGNKEPEDLLDDSLEAVPGLYVSEDDLLDDRFQNITEKTIRREIENYIEDNDYERLMKIQNSVMFRCCMLGIARHKEQEGAYPSFDSPMKSLEHYLAFFSLLMEYQNQIGKIDEPETEVIIKRKGT